MASEQYDEKRGPNMGSRSTTRHGAQAGASAGGLALILQALVEAKHIDVQQAFLGLAILTPLLTTAWKAWDGLDGLARLKAALNRRFPAAILLLPLLGIGCAIQIGTAEPEQFSTLGGGTMIACKTKGITFVAGDADLCSNTARGGKVSRTFADMTLGVVRTAGAMVAGFFGGAGQGMMQAMEKDEAAAVEAEAAQAAPAPADAGWEAAPSGNPFTAPDPE